MRRKLIFVFACSFVILSAASVRLPLQAAPEPQSPPQGAAQQQAFLNQYCIACHNQNNATAGLALDRFDLANPSEHAEIWEHVIRKVGGGMMPPAGMRRPDREALSAFVSFLETSLDRAAAANPNPGRTVLHRLNRAEYANAIRDLLGLEVDVAVMLPPDEHAHGFDNIADVLSVSPTLIDRYLAAAWKISSTAIGITGISPTTETFRVREDLSQHDHIEGLPIGTRGGILVKHHFPVDGEYVFKPKLFKNTVDVIRGLEFPHEIEVSLDGERIQLVRFGGGQDEYNAYLYPAATADEIEKRFEVRVPVQAGPHELAVAFIKKSSAPSVSVLQPFLRERIDPITMIGIPELASVIIEGPFNVAAPGNSPSRQKIFVCAPAAESEESACAENILSTLARRAYRRPPADAEVARLIGFYQAERDKGGSFDSGIEAALAFLLVSPQFLFRFEDIPENVPPGGIYRISDMELASRLSFFIWSSIPDDELLDLAAAGRLQDTAVLEQQVKRMLADERARALGSNFAGQWLYLRNLNSIVPDKSVFYDFDDNLRQALQRETEMLFESIVLEDRSVLELLSADYTFVNERLARHYGITGIYGTQFRRVPVMHDHRRGLLGQGSILTLTSYPNRTSPVNRGSYILTNILGTPPPEPPANVPPLDETPRQASTMRERMAEHRANPACSACHQLMDPIGLALENFDGIGRWRASDAGVLIDPSSTLADGTDVDGPAGLRQAILDRPQQFARTVSEMLLTYALGRGLEPYDMPVVRSVLTEAAAADYRFSSLVMGIAKSLPFQMKTKPLEERQDENLAENNRADRPVLASSAGNQ